MMPLNVTAHALRRYQERIDRTADADRVAELAAGPRRPPKWVSQPHPGRKVVIAGECLFAVQGDTVITCWPLRWETARRDKAQQRASRRDRVRERRKLRRRR